MRPVAKGAEREFSAYVIVSALALAIDVAVLYALAVVGSMDRPLAAVIAYVVGLAFHYWLAISHVFSYRRYAQQQDREFLGYVLTGCIGVAVSYLIVLAGTRLAIALAISKAVAVVVSFGITYLARRRLLFSRWPEPNRTFSE
jgi:putative flippase GtrA